MRALKPITALALTAAGTALVVGFRVPDAAVTATGVGTTGTPATTGSVSASSAAYGDGTWLGAEVEEPWGAFQVEATVSDGAITGISVVKAPTDRHSSRINDASIPALTEAAIASQDADVDTISGATWTARSFAASLQAALDDAAAAADAAA